MATYSSSSVPFSKATTSSPVLSARFATASIPEASPFLSTRSTASKTPVDDSCKRSPSKTLSEDIGLSSKVNGQARLLQASLDNLMKQNSGTKDVDKKNKRAMVEEESSILQGRLSRLDSRSQSPPSSPAPIKREQVPYKAAVGPAWTRGEIEKPAGTRDMGGWTASVYTDEQQRRLKVDELGKPKAPLPSPALSSRSLPSASPAMSVRSLASQSSVAGSIKGASSKRTASPLKVLSEDFADMPEVSAWQSEIDKLEETQVKQEQNLMNLLQSQIHLLTRELGKVQQQMVQDRADINAKVGSLEVEIKTAQAEAHAALRLELAEHGKNAEEMKAAWAEAHQALTDAFDDNLNQAADDQDKAMADQALVHSTNLGALEQKMTEKLEKFNSDHHALHDSHAAKHAAQGEKLQQGLDDVVKTVHGNLMRELSELSSNHTANLRDIMEDVTQQVDLLTTAMENVGVMRQANSKKVERVFGDMQNVLSSYSFKGGLPDKTTSKSGLPDKASRKR